ncbi:MAG TPA: TIGR01212 family radical SAM protein [Polyangiaceae bacterium]|nr:TIGR01212 family radical SAM protein [Polyangiaceae bacterium]
MAELSHYVNTLGRALRERYGERVHKVAIDAGFTCPNRDGSAGRGGCTFCNNASFSPNHVGAEAIETQIDRGRAVIARRTGARRLLAYFQAYTNTYAAVSTLSELYDRALNQPGVIGLSVGTRPDCVPDAVLDLLESYADRGLEVWLELGLQSSFDETLRRVNRGHGFPEYRDAIRRARHRGLQVCTHLITGLPGETAEHALTTLARVLDEGTQGLKLHPLHVVRGTLLARDLRLGTYQPWPLQDYVDVAVEMIERTPWPIVYHRLTGTAPAPVLLGPAWCSSKWRVLNAIRGELERRGTRQGHATSEPAFGLAPASNSGVDAQSSCSEQADRANACPC